MPVPDKRFYEGRSQQVKHIPSQAQVRYRTQQENQAEQGHPNQDHQDLPFQQLHP